MILNLQNSRHMAKELSRMLFKNKVRMDYLLYTDVERDAIPAAFISNELAGLPIAAASPMILGPNGRRGLDNSVLFSVVSDDNFWTIWSALQHMYKSAPTTASFFKLVEDPLYWLLLLPGREGDIECQWQ